MAQSINTLSIRIARGKERYSLNRKERIECVDCGKWFQGEPTEPHVCEECSK